MLELLKKSAFPLALLLGLLTRALGIASRPLWYDEAFAVLFSEKGPAAMLVGTLAPTGAGTADIHPITYYTLLWLWMRAFGESPVAVRSLSVLTSVAVLAVIYILARSLFGTRTALASALIAALAPFQVHYGQEIRMYALLCLWLLLATFCYWRGSHLVLERSPSASRSWPWWLGFAVFAALGQYTHNLAAFYLVALALWPAIMRQWRVVQWVVLAGLFSLLLYLPWLVHLPSQFAKVSQAYWVARPGVSQLFTLFVVFVTNTPLFGWELPAGLFVALFVVVIGVRQTVSAARQQVAGVHEAIWLLYLSLVPAALLFLFSQWKPVYIERALLPSGAVFCIWLAWVLLKSQLPRPILVLVAASLALAFGIGLYEHLTYDGFPYAPYASLDRYLESARENGDVILHSNKISMMPAAYYDRSLPETYVSDPPGSGQDTLAPSTQEVLGLAASPDIRTAVGTSGRVWFIISERSNQEYVSAGYAGHPDLLWLQQHLSQRAVSSWGDLRLYLFLRVP